MHDALRSSQTRGLALDGSTRSERAGGGRCWLSPAPGVRRSFNGFPSKRREPREPSERPRLAGRERNLLVERLTAKKKRCSPGPRRRRVEEMPFRAQSPTRSSSRAPRCHRTARAAAWIQAACCVPTETHRERVPPRRGDAASNGSRCLPSLGSNSRVRDESRGSLELETSPLLRTETNPRTPFQPLGSARCRV